jgi:hypothetical protein
LMWKCVVDFIYNESHSGCVLTPDDHYKQQLIC